MAGKQGGLQEGLAWPTSRWGISEETGREAAQTSTNQKQRAETPSRKPARELQQQTSKSRGKGFSMSPTGKDASKPPGEALRTRPGGCTLGLMEDQGPESWKETEGWTSRKGMDKATYSLES